MARAASCLGDLGAGKARFSCFDLRAPLRGVVAKTYSLMKHWCASVQQEAQRSVDRLRVARSSKARAQRREHALEPRCRAPGVDCKTVQQQRIAGHGAVPLAEEVERPNRCGQASRPPMASPSGGMQPITGRRIPRIGRTSCGISVSACAKRAEASGELALRLQDAAEIVAGFGVVGHRSRAAAYRRARPHRAVAAGRSAWRTERRRLAAGAPAEGVCLSGAALFSVHARRFRLRRADSRHGDRKRGLTTPNGDLLGCCKLHFV